MLWFDKTYHIDGHEVQINGTLEESVVKIVAFVEISKDHLADWGEHIFLEKPVNMWAHQEIFAEDVLQKYQGKIRKCEQKLPSLVEKYKINKSI